MSRNKGSRELFDLIHSLTPEEKGYYRKFAKRHVTDGSNYLKLFDLISKQEDFEEEDLRKKFRNYPVMKVYLKDFITDSLLLYHKNRHSHVSLFAEVQKIHILLVKGQFAEAVRILKKAMDHSRQMELFTVERYLMRILSEISHQHLTSPKVIGDFQKQYKHLTEQNWEKESNLTQWELRNAELFARVRGRDPFAQPISDVDIQSILSEPASSMRSELKKLNCLNYFYYLRKDAVNTHDVTKRQLKLSEDYKKKGDSSFNNIFIRNNYIISNLDLERFGDAIKQADEMLKGESKLRFYYDLAFPKSVLFKLDAYFHMARYKEGLDLVKQTEKEMQRICVRLGDETAMREYYLFKLIYLFSNRLYQQCWIEMQTVKLSRLMEGQMVDFADYTMLQLMLQYEMGNYKLVNSMAAKSEKTFKRLKVGDTTYQTLIGFFKNVQPANTKDLALKTLAALKEHYKKDKLPSRKAFGLLDYLVWLESVGKPVKEK